MATEALIDERLDRIEATLDLIQENLAEIRIIVDGMRSSRAADMQRRVALTVVGTDRN
jgi:hypothetical protein